ncbi:hypothetical protein C6A85_73290, partial [Mycobacterium sp. ITM-2017-0098]
MGVYGSADRLDASGAQTQTVASGQDLSGCRIEVRHIVIRLDDNDAVSDRIDHRGDIAGASCQFGEMVLGMKGLLKV